jgi:hypothetical protein
VNEQNNETYYLLLVARTLRFATDHPYAATGIFGAVVGSVATYKVLTFKEMREKMNKVFTPKVYELVLTSADLHKMLDDPAYEVRVETTDTSVIITGEKREPLKALPDIEHKEST